MNSYLFVDPSHIQKEKRKMPMAKKSRWWQQKCASGKCFYCGQAVSFQNLTMDHVVPLARGGTTAPGNVVPACRPCNKTKGADTPVDLIFR